MENKSEWKQERTWPVIQAELIKQGPEAIAKHNAEVLAELDKRAITTNELREKYASFTA